LLYLSKGTAFFVFKDKEWTCMQTRIAVISIIVEKQEAVVALNELLHQYSQYVIGRMGIPYRHRGISIISVAVEAPQDAISALSGKLGRMEGVSAKATYSNYIFEEDAQ
jgi:putative iron-only hydrogenase system regulator